MRRPSTLNYTLIKLLRRNLGETFINITEFCQTSRERPRLNRRCPSEERQLSVSSGTGWERQDFPKRGSAVGPPRWETAAMCLSLGAVMTNGSSCTNESLCTFTHGAQLTKDLCGGLIHGAATLRSAATGTSSPPPSASWRLRQPSCCTQKLLFCYIFFESSIFQI